MTKGMDKEDMKQANDSQKEMMENMPQQCQQQ
jgi:hypothetical protein